MSRFQSLHFTKPPGGKLYRTNKHDQTLSTDHPYVAKKVDLTHLRFLTVDPVGSLDADDAFSVIEEDDMYILRIAIADPTHWIDPNSETLMMVIKNGITNYLTGDEPDHMLSNEILDHSNLIGNCQAVVVSFYLDKMGTLIRQPEIDLAKIKIDPENDKCSYRDDLMCIKEVRLGLHLAKMLSEKRQGIDLSGMNLSTIEKKDGKVKLVKETDITRSLQKMIAEFAIQTNAWIGTFLHQRYGTSIYRICAAPKSLLKKIGSVMEVMDHFIESGVSANYSTSDESHDMVNCSHYTHFTSPIRRSVDLIIHYLVKSILLDLPEPFSETDLNLIAGYLDPKNRLSRQNGFNNTKLNLYQWLYQETTKQPVIITIRYQGIRGVRHNFINFSIIRVQSEETHNVRVSCSIPIGYFYGTFTETVDKHLIDTPEHDITITKVNIGRKNDNEILDEIFNWFVSQCNE